MYPKFSKHPVPSRAALTLYVLLAIANIEAREKIHSRKKNSLSVDSGKIAIDNVDNHRGLKEVVSSFGYGSAGHVSSSFLQAKADPALKQVLHNPELTHEFQEIKKQKELLSLFMFPLSKIHQHLDLSSSIDLLMEHEYVKSFGDNLFELFKGRLGQQVLAQVDYSPVFDIRALGVGAMVYPALAAEKSSVDENFSYRFEHRIKFAALLHFVDRLRDGFATARINLKWCEPFYDIHPDFFLFPNWKSERSGDDRYYWNKETGVTQWEHPDEQMLESFVKGKGFEIFHYENKEMNDGEKLLDEKVTPDEEVDFTLFFAPNSVGEDVVRNQFGLDPGSIQAGSGRPNSHFAVVDTGSRTCYHALNVARIPSPYKPELVKPLMDGLQQFDRALFDSIETFLLDSDVKDLATLETKSPGVFEKLDEFVKSYEYEPEDRVLESCPLAPLYDLDFIVPDETQMKIIERKRLLKEKELLSLFVLPLWDEHKNLDLSSSVDRLLEHQQYVRSFGDTLFESFRVECWEKLAAGRARARGSDRPPVLEIRALGVGQMAYVPDGPNDGDDHFKRIKERIQFAALLHFINRLRSSETFRDAQINLKWCETYFDDKFTSLAKLPSSTELDLEKNHLEQEQMMLTTVLEKKGFTIAERGILEQKVISTAEEPVDFTLFFMPAIPSTVLKNVLANQLELDGRPNTNFAIVDDVSTYSEPPHPLRRDYQDYLDIQRIFKDKMNTAKHVASPYDSRIFASLFDDPLEKDKFDLEWKQAVDEEAGDTYYFQKKINEDEKQVFQNNQWKMPIVVALESSEVTTLESSPDFKKLFESVLSKQVEFPAELLKSCPLESLYLMDFIFPKD